MQVPVEMTEDHGSSRLESLLIIPSSIVPGKPFEIFRVDEAQIIFIDKLRLLKVIPFLIKRPLSCLIVCSLNILRNNTAISKLFFGYHLFEINVTDWKFEIDFLGLVFKPILVLRLKDHTNYAVELYPLTINGPLIVPSPVKLSNIIKYS